MNTSAHTPALQNHAVSWPFSSSNSNGKEKDHESGFHYYGARYYWSEVLTGWLSVDPMMDKYPDISPYHYCHWNPINLVDLDGKEDEDDWYKNEKGQLQWDPSVTKDTPLKNGEEYLGETILLTNGNDQTIYGDENGELHTSVPLPEVSISGVAGTTEKEANVAVPVSVPISAFLWDRFSATVVEAIESVAAIAWMIPACLLFSGDSSPNQKANSNEDVQTSSGKKTDQHGNVLGGSGKPRVNTVHHSSQKKAKDAARNQGKGQPVKHPSPKRGKPHYHPTDKAGEKIPGSTHHEYKK